MISFNDIKANSAALNRSQQNSTGLGSFEVRQFLGSLFRSNITIESRAFNPKMLNKNTLNKIQPALEEGICNRFVSLWNFLSPLDNLLKLGRCLDASRIWTKLDVFAVRLVRNVISIFCNSHSNLKVFATWAFQIILTILHEFLNTALVGIMLALICCVADIQIKRHEFFILLLLLLLWILLLLSTIAKTLILKLFVFSGASSVSQGRCNFLLRHRFRCLVGHCLGRKSLTANTLQLDVLGTF
mmetsp:Transcript_17138/g.25674  ORF Transcript_17138/g.25674 Transcript_17138/m.25674 type:complete len:243 (-) Transcript_17138:74-802(-)